MYSGGFSQTNDIVISKMHRNEAILFFLINR